MPPFPPGDTVFKAKAQRAELEEAEVVAESHDTEVEQPIDLEEAEEVEEERAELAEEGGATVSDKVLRYMHNTFIAGWLAHKITVHVQ